MNNATLTPEESKRMKELLFNIRDNLNAIEIEVNKPTSVFRYYIEEKLNKINIDMSCINYIIKGDE